MAPAQADTVEVDEGSSSKTIDTACAIFQADHLVDDGDTPEDPEDDEYEHVNIYICGDLYDDNGDGTADRASALAARFVDGHEEERYQGEVATSDITVDAAGGTASIAATVDSVLSTGAENCTISVDFTSIGAAEPYEGGGATLEPSLDGTGVRLTTDSSYSGTDQPATAAGTACGWSELAEAHEDNSARISTYSQTDEHTTVSVNA